MYYLNHPGPKRKSIFSFQQHLYVMNYPQVTGLRFIRLSLGTKPSPTHLSQCSLEKVAGYDCQYNKQSKHAHLTLSLSRTTNMCSVCGK